MQNICNKKFLLTVIFISATFSLYLILYSPLPLSIINKSNIDIPMGDITGK